MKRILSCAVAAAALAGCATVDSAPSAEREESVYRTGSNIPTRQRAGQSEGVKTYDREALERARDQAVPMPRGGIPGSTPGT